MQVESEIPESQMIRAEPDIDEYLRKRLMPVEGVIPLLNGIEMYGNSIPAGRVGGDLFEYINFQQRYNIDARTCRAIKLSQKYLEPLSEGTTPGNEVDLHVHWLESGANFTLADAIQYRKAKSSEQLRIAEALQELHTTAGVLLVDAQGHGIMRQRSRQPCMIPFIRPCSLNWTAMAEQLRRCSRELTLGLRGLLQPATP